MNWNHPTARHRRDRRAKAWDRCLFRKTTPRRNPRRGLILLVVLVAIPLLALAGYTFTELMLTERKAADVSGRLAQAYCSADSGLQMVRLFLAQPTETIDQSGGWYDNADRFQGVLVADSDAAVERGRFSVVAPTFDDSGNRGVRFGVEDESTRLNLVALLAADEASPGTGRESLMQLPSMTEDIADAILDWIDSDDTPREFGAESDYYAGLDPPYAAKNAPPETIEELLLVRDVTAGMLFGWDANRNGLVDADETNNDALNDLDNTANQMDRGWAAYLTLYSRQSNLNPEGEAKINLNQDDLETLHSEVEAILGAEAADFVVLYRQYGPYTGDREGDLDEQVDLDLEQAAQHQFESVLDLIGAKVEIPTEGQSGGESPPDDGGPPDDANPAAGDDSDSTVVASPFADIPGSMQSFLPDLMDYCTTDDRTTLPGRININQAPRVVLATIPGLSADLIEQVLAEREPDPAYADDSQRQPTWILESGIVDLEQMKALLPFVTAGGSVYRVQVVGYFDDSGVSARIEAVIDTTSSLPTVVSWRQLSHLGRGYPAETLAVDPDI